MRTTSGDETTRRGNDLHCRNVVDWRRTYLSPTKSGCGAVDVFFFFVVVWIDGDAFVHDVHVVVCDGVDLSTWKKYESMNGRKAGERRKIPFALTERVAGMQLVLKER